MKKLANIVTDLLILVLFAALAGILILKLVYGMEMKAVMTISANDFARCSRKNTN